VPSEIFSMSDNPTPIAETGTRFRPFAELIFSLSFLTRLPIPFSRTLDPPALAQSMRFFAVAGALIGAANGVFLVLLHTLHVPPVMAAAFTCLFGLMVTGGLHEDGLADSADGLFGGKSRESRLEIMRDSRIGSYGAMALFSCLLARVGAFEALYNFPAWVSISIIASSAAFSRAMVVDLMWATRPARADGLSVFAGRPSRNSALFAIVIGGALVIATGALVRPESGVAAVLAALAITGMMRRTAVRLIGGQTGDICGATQVLVELSMLAVFTSMIG
jgi:adenosylcobinamide-GDP ribazoletransferase